MIWGSKITADGDCSHEIKRRLLLGRKVMTNLDSILKSRDITLPTKVCLVKAMVFPVVMYGCESWTLKSLLQHHSSKASILQRLAFFIVQLSRLYMTTRKTIALAGQTFVSKVISLLFNKLSRLIIAFLPRNKYLLISWLQSPSAVILEPPKIKSFTVSIVSPSICHEVMGLGAMILVFQMLSFKPTFSLSSFTFIKRLFSSSSLNRWEPLWQKANTHYMFTISTSTDLVADCVPSARNARGKVQNCHPRTETASRWVSK